MVQKSIESVPTVHVQGGSAIRRPLIVLAVCAVGVVAYLARDFLIPTAAAIVLALIMTPVAKKFERLRLPPTAAAGASVSLLALVVAGVLAVSAPALSAWAEQAPYLTYTLERKLEGLRKSLAFVKQVTDRVEQATQAQPAQANTERKPPETVVVREQSLLSELMSTTPAVLLQIGYAAVLSFMILAHRNDHKRQILRVPINFTTRVRIARVMRDINDRVGTYLFALVVIYSLVAVVSTIVLALLGFPNPILWGVLVGLASFVPFVGPPVAIGLVAFVALLTYDDWVHMLAAPAILAAIHFVESQLITPAFVSRRCALNTVAVFSGVAFLGWMWGAVGAIVAVPLLILISTVAAHLPSLRWLEVLLSEDRPVSDRLAVKPPLASVTPVQVRRRRVATK
ncbi:AI-2E family transporter [Reyranella sp.]|uniref:AI-2E family transporter n=1 Tax=Reyranella sp. TaxID=1929291 RepID=UPI00272725A2|nr:AI-2E family transporter [Reyranella sp.]MDO8976234.1 AI-2E family transporter [Reyranella sp.]